MERKERRRFVLGIRGRTWVSMLTVHDEVVCDTPDEIGSVEAFHDLLTETPDWADGCPVAAECWEGERYRK